MKSAYSEDTGDGLLLLGNGDGLEAGQNLAGVGVPDAEQFLAGGLAAGEDDAGLGEAEEFSQVGTAGRVGRALYRWRSQPDAEASWWLLHELIARGTGVHLDCHEHVRTSLHDSRTIGSHAWEAGFSGSGSSRSRWVLSSPRNLLAKRSRWRFNSAISA